MWFTENKTFFLAAIAMICATWALYSNQIDPGIYKDMWYGALGAYTARTGIKKISDGFGKK